ncbi:MAG: o-succinylbenzoate synthase [Cyclobacteriaceae bacterium]|nr:o-succinylbenzoate synthase [Cyclobacteriaceae bacterium]
MKLNWEIYAHHLDFAFKAKTSRGEIKQKEVFYIRVFDEKGVSGWGECSPIKGLSPDGETDYMRYFQRFKLTIPQEINEPEDLLKLIPDDKPALKMGVETALMDYIHGGKKLIFDNDFSRGRVALPINGLIWMGDYDFMMEQLEIKLKEGFSCIKIKVGSLDFEKECSILDYIRKKYSPSELTLRLDANGAFSSEEALDKLNVLSAFGIHSIEQPIMPGKYLAMKELIRQSPIPIAFDEELIAVKGTEAKRKLLSDLKPHYIILKPSLLGGFSETAEWIQLAEAEDIGWWITSFLESNIGLNAIAQFTGNYQINIPQGLGTGKIYHNNIDSPLSIRGESLYLDLEKSWDMTKIRK